MMEMINLAGEDAFIISDTVHKTALRLRLTRLSATFVIMLLTILALCAPVSSAASIPPSATPDPQQLLRNILDDPDLQQREATVVPPPTPSFPRINLSFLRWIFVGVGAALIVLLIVILGPFLFRYFVKLRRQRKQMSLVNGAEVATSDEAISRAQDASAMQNYRQALRLLYLAALLKLDEIGALRYDRALTNREYVRQVTLKPALSGALRPVVEIFDDVWYGYQPITPEGYATFASNVDHLIKAAEIQGEIRDRRLKIEDQI